MKDYDISPEVTDNPIASLLEVISHDDEFSRRRALAKWIDNYIVRVSTKQTLLHAKDYPLAVLDEVQARAVGEIIESLHESNCVDVNIEDNSVETILYAIRRNLKNIST